MSLHIHFPNIDLVIKRKKKKRIYSVEDIQCLLSNIRRYELGGEYLIGKGFLIDPKVSWYDYDSDRPYTTLNLQSTTGVVWHSHPYGIELRNSFPSFEDLLCVQVNLSLIFFIMTGKGMYIMSSTKRVETEDIKNFYESMDDHNIEDNFVNYELTEEISNTIGIFMTCIPNSIITIDLIDRYISYIDQLKNDSDINV